jgi:hypothetical protein
VTVPNLTLGPECSSSPIDVTVGSREPCWEGKQKKVFEACNGLGSSSMDLGRVLDGMDLGGEIGDTSLGGGVVGLPSCV